MVKKVAEPETGARLARRLLREAERAALSTALPVPGSIATGEAEPGGWPYGSLVLLASDLDGAPLLLISELAEHARNLAADPRASLLLDGTAGMKNPLAGPRLTLLGRAARDPNPRALERFLRRHPAARLYAGFRDFHLWRLELERAHLVAGFGRIEWLPAGALLLGPTQWRWLAAREKPLLDGLNEPAPLKRRRGWHAVGLDPDGLDLWRAGRHRRVAFAERLGSEKAARAAVARAARIRP
jgi:hypothetical protein